MLTGIVVACALAAVTVIVHAGGLALLFKGVLSSLARPPTRLGPMTWLFVRVTWMLMLIHMIEIAIWGAFYVWAGCLPDAESAFYFSGVTYATVGYGDLVLPQPWRMLGPAEGLAGILMCGLSTGFFFALFSRILNAKFKA